MKRQDPLLLESAILERFRGLDNNKKILKLNTKIAAESKDMLTSMVCETIAKAKDPKAWLEFCYTRIEDSLVIKTGIIEDGGHGMIVHNREVYPVKLNTRENWLQEDKEWSHEDEDEIMDSLVRAWMKENDMSVFSGKIVLFPEFGFSGQMIFLEI